MKQQDPRMVECEPYDSHMSLDHIESFRFHIQPYENRMGAV